MSYQEDVALVLEAMPEEYRLDDGQWYVRAVHQQYVHWWPIAIDANFIVERAIPWARSRGLVLTVFWIDPNPAAKVEEQEDPRFPPQWGQKPAFHEAVMAALAAALRAEQ